jgi:hypothetical protein
MKYLLLMAFVAWALVPANAAEHKIDFTVVLTDADDQPFVECADPVNVLSTDPACKQKRPVTLGLVAERSLIAAEQGITAEESLMRGQLALSVLHSTGADLKVEEIALIKKRIAAVYGPLIVARTFPMLDPATK